MVRSAHAQMKVLIADDHPIVRQGLKQILAADPELAVVGEATNGDDALRLARSLAWDVAIFDFSMPGRSGLELIADVKRAYPQRPVLILSMHSEQLHAARVLKAGAAGYISKESAPQELTQAVRKVARGGTYVSQALAEILAGELTRKSARPPHERLSDREYRVMWFLASGKQTGEIAAAMLLRPSTVSTYRTRILRKLGLRNNAELVQYAIRNQLVD